MTSSRSTEQNHLTEYALEVLRHNGIKSARAWWPNARVLAITVDPSATEKARPLLATIQQRANKSPGLRVALDEPDADWGEEDTST